MRVNADKQLLAVAAFLLTLIASPSPGASEDSQALLNDAKLLPVPLCRQSTSYTCGPAALQSVFGYYGIDLPEDQLATELKTNKREGTHYQGMVDVARAHRLTAELRENMSLEQLAAELGAGHPVICLIQAWADHHVDYSRDWSDGHYVVAVGKDARQIYFMDPWTLGQLTYIPAEELNARWHDRQRGKKVIRLGIVFTTDRPPYNQRAVKKVL